MNLVLQETLPAHLEALLPEQWAIWRWFVLRGAGFPANLIDSLAQPLCAGAADSLIQAEHILEERFHAAIREFNSELDQLAAKGTSREDHSFKNLLKARRRLTNRKLTESAELPENLANHLTLLANSIAARNRLETEFTDQFAQCLQTQRNALQVLARDNRFQEAVIWQNLQGFETAVRPMAEGQERSGRNQHQRNHELLVARYAQRYCVKNDSIGFFGPVVWGKIQDVDRNLEVRPGASLMNRRQTYFESWAIDRLAASLSRLEGMEWWIAPRLAPDVLIEEERLHRPGAPAVNITELEQYVLQLCDGQHLPDEILERVKKHERFRDVQQQEIRDLLRARADEGTVTWRFQVGVEVNAEISLAEQLAKVGDLKLRTSATNLMDKLLATREEVSRSAGNPVELNQALRNAGLIFEEITSTSGYRNPGTTYGARTILYEDCRRDLALQITPALLKPIVPALSLLFQSLRWLMQSTALEFLRLFHQTFQELRAHSSKENMGLLDWWLYTEPKLLDAPSIAEIEKAFKQKWAALLPFKTTDSVTRFSSSDLKEKVDQLFPALGAGYYPVRYFCPDLMLAARDAASIQRGELLYVLGEVHSAKNTLGHTALTEQHHDIQELITNSEWDLSRSCFKIAIPQEVETNSTRTSEGLLRPGDFLVSTTPDSIAPRGHQTHPISDLFLHEHDEELYAVSHSTGKRFHILEAFSDLLFGFVVNKASWIQPASHVPRVMIDDLVIHRESWRFSRDELMFAMEKEESGRFLSARKWMNNHRIPRKTFVRSASEMKPFYLDMEIPVLVEALCRTVHQMKPSGEEVAFSEMLPDAEQLWLQDAAGNQYTSELRLAVVDLQARSLSVSE